MNKIITVIDNHLRLYHYQYNYNKKQIKIIYYNKKIQIKIYRLLNNNNKYYNNNKIYKINNYNTSNNILINNKVMIIYINKIKSYNYKYKMMINK